MLRRILIVFGSLILLLVIGIASLYRSDIPASVLIEKYRTPESKWIKILDANVHVRDRGKGPAVFLIHGSFSSLHTWNSWEDSLVSNFRTISMDLPGHGLTGPNGQGIYSQDYYVQIVMGIADHLGIDTFHIAGNSMGGDIAYRIALKKPDRVKKLVLIDAAGAPSDTTVNPANKKGRPFIFSLLANPIGSRLLVKCTPRFLFKYTMNGVYGNPSLITDEQIDRYYELILLEGNRKATIDRIKSPKSKPEKGEVKCPTLILWGEMDKWIPVENAFRFNAVIPGSILHVMPSTGHVPMEEQPAVSVKIVKSFLLGQEKTGPSENSETIRMKEKVDPRQFSQ